MAYDGIITYGMTKELSSLLKLGKIDKIYQPAKEMIIIQFHTTAGNFRLLASCNGMSSRLCLTENKYENPVNPPNFCMVLRKYLLGGRVIEIRQKDSERIIEMDIEALSEMGFTISRKLIFELMGKHSNIILVDMDTNKIIDACKRISIDVNQYRQTLAGAIYKYPPVQDKIPFKGITGKTDIGENAKIIIGKVAGISPAVAREISNYNPPAKRLDEIISSVDKMCFKARIYFDKGVPIEFHLADLSEYKDLDIKYYGSLSECVEYFYFHKENTNLLKQKSAPLHRNVKKLLDKAGLKKKRLNEDILSAEKSKSCKLYGELLTANLHMVKGGESTVELLNWYDGSLVKIPLDTRLSPAKNAQRFFKKYSKSKVALKEKKIQLIDVDRDIEYLESVLLSIDNAKSVDDLALIRSELEDEGYIRAQNQKNNKNKRNLYKPSPLKYILSSGYTAYVGRNNRENDYLTTKFAKKTDLWLHTKDIAGSHVIVSLPNDVQISDLDPDIIYEAASIAAYHSKASKGENVPVDYVSVRRVKKPKNAKPGMVIFDSNKTVYVNPSLPT